MYYVFVLLLEKKKYTNHVYMKYDSFWSHFNTISLQQTLRSLSITECVTKWMAFRVISTQLTDKPNCDIQYKALQPLYRTEKQKNALTQLCMKHIIDICAYAEQRAYLNRGKTFLDTIVKKIYVWKCICPLLYN